MKSRPKKYRKPVVPQALFRPEEEIRRLRTVSRQRDMLPRYRSAHVQHTEKALHQMNNQLDNVISDITGSTGLAILRSIIAGERNPNVLARHRDPHCRCSEEDIIKSLEGSYVHAKILRLISVPVCFDSPASILPKSMASMLSPGR